LALLLVLVLVLLFPCIHLRKSLQGMRHWASLGVTAFIIMYMPSGESLRLVSGRQQGSVKVTGRAVKGQALWRLPTPTCLLRMTCRMRALADDASPLVLTGSIP
jgi:hypothetical protein